jgi:hypothetical protein
VAPLEQDVFVAKLLVAFFHNTSFGKVLQMNIPCSAMYEYIPCTTVNLVSRDGVPLLCVGFNDIKKLRADLLNQANVIFSNVWGYDYM